MLTSALFFLFAFATVATLIWSGIEVFSNQEDALGDRLEELRSTNTMVVSTQTASRRRSGGGFWNQLLYVFSLAGMEGWLKENEKELTMAGVHNKQAVAYYALGNLIFFLLMAAGAIWLQR